MNPDKGKQSLFKDSLREMPITDTLVDALEICLNAVIIFDADEQIIFWNPAAEKIYGWTAGEALGKTAVELFWPDISPLEQETQKQQLLDIKRGMTVHGQFHPCHKNGSSLVVEYVAQTVFEDGQFSGILTVHQEITGRVQAAKEIGRLKAELKIQRDENNSIMEILPVGIWIGNKDCSIITGNTAAYRITGLPAGSNASISNTDTDQPLDFRVFVDGVEVQPEDAPMQKVARTGKPMYNFENEILYPDNTRKTIYTSVVPILDGQGKVQRVIGAFTDFTERKQAMEQLRLAHEYAEQTADRISRLQKVTEALSEALTPAKVADVLVHQGATALGAVTGTMMLLTEDGQSLQTVQSVAPETVLRPYKKFSVSLHVPAADAVRSGQPIWIESPQEFLERYPHLADHISAWGHQTAVSIPMVEDGRTIGVLNLSFEKRLPDTIDNIGFAMNLARQGAQALERARLYQAEQQARQSAERAVDRMTRLMHVTAALSGITNSSNSVEEVIQQGILATRANGGLIVELTAGSQDLKTMTVMGFPAEMIESDFPRLMESTPISDSIDGKEPVWIHSQEEFSVKYPTLAELWQSLKITAAAVIPLIVGERLLGSIAFTFTETHEFDQEEKEFFLAVARKCALGLERARTEEALRESEKQLQSLNISLANKVQEQTAEVRKLASDLTKAEQRERHRLAQILHEDLQQRIYAILIELDFLRDKDNIEGETLQTELDEARRQLREVLALMRHLSIDLSPPILRDEGLAQAIGWLVSQIQEQHGLQVDFKADGPITIQDEDIQMLLFTCVRELLFNVVEHAGVKRAAVTLQRVNDHLRIDVRDEGKGFNVAALASLDESTDASDLKFATIGLSTLRYRLSLFNGQMDIHSGPDTGTLVTITIPVPKYLPGLHQLAF